jgi:DNA-binding NarL/FixJ family response regulator
MARILIVEDEALVALDIEQVLRSAGFEVVGIADTQAAAVAEATRLAPDLILMDITLREGNGIEAARALGARVPIVFVSANADQGTLAAAHAARPAGFIRKPFGPDELVATVGHVIGRRRRG